MIQFFAIITHKYEYNESKQIITRYDCYLKHIDDYRNTFKYFYHKEFYHTSYITFIQIFKSHYYFEKINIPKIYDEIYKE